MLYLTLRRSRELLSVLFTNAKRVIVSLKHSEYVLAGNTKTFCISIIFRTWDFGGSNFEDFVIWRSSHREYSIKKLFLKILQNSQESTFARVSFLIKLQTETCNFVKNETLAQLFSCWFCEIFMNILFYRAFLGNCFCF